MTKIKEVEQRLRAAIEHALETGIAIRPRRFGLTTETAEYDFADYDGAPGVCAVGAFLLGKNKRETDDQFDSAARHLGVRPKDMRALVHGFDSIYTNCSDFWQLGRQLRRDYYETEDRY